MLAPTAMGMMYRGIDKQDETAKDALGQNLYTSTLFGVVPMEGKDAAEEMFDLTNNPGRQDEREERYGRGRSLSTGDIVQVDETLYLCCSFGWKVLDVELPAHNKV